MIPQLALVGLHAQAPIEQNHSFGVVMVAAAEIGLDEGRAVSMAEYDDAWVDGDDAD